MAILQNSSNICLKVGAPESFGLKKKNHNKKSEAKLLTLWRSYTFHVLISETEDSGIERWQENQLVNYRFYPINHTHSSSFTV